MTLDEFMDYYENQHSQLSKRQGRAPSIPNAVRYVRRYLKPEKNPVTGAIHDPGFDCIMEIWWNSREDFERSQKIIAAPDRLDAVKRSEEHTSELQSLMRISYAVFCLKKKKTPK